MNNRYYPQNGYQQGQYAPAQQYQQPQNCPAPVQQRAQHHFDGEEKGTPTQKYMEARAKAIEMIESGKYALTDSDFWVLSRKGLNVGLIVTHNGCLKINSSIQNKVNPQNFVIDKDGFGKSLVIMYRDNDTFEVGEVNAANCASGYPYAMALKRCFDRVVLKKSRLAFAGVYSEAESSEFSQPEPQTQVQAQPVQQTVNAADQVPQIMTAPAAQEMSVAEAMAHRIKSGAYAGRSMSEMINRPNGLAFIYGYANSGSPLDQAAAKVITKGVESGQISIPAQASGAR